MIAGIISIILLMIGIVMLAKGCDEDNGVLALVGFCITGVCMYLVGLFICLNLDIIISWFKI